MNHSDFKIGQRFTNDHLVVNGSRRRVWQVTDVGTRTIIAITAHEGWVAGPPYAIAETVFDEFDIDGCSPVPAL